MRTTVERPICFPERTKQEVLSATSKDGSTVVRKTNAIHALLSKPLNLVTLNPPNLLHFRLHICARNEFLSPLA